MQVDISIGHATTTSLRRGHLPNTSGVEGVRCGIWGCGLLEIAKLGPNKDIIGWVEPLLPPAPPMQPKPTRPQSDGVGAAIAQFNLVTGEASAIRPLTLDIENQSLPLLLGPSGLVGIDDDDNYWFACYPHAADMSTEGLCYLSMKAPDAPIKTLAWSNKQYSITAMQYSTALKSVVVLAQVLARRGTWQMHDVISCSKPRYGHVYHIG
mgnify:CR=1 FL=1